MVEEKKEINVEAIYSDEEDMDIDELEGLEAISLAARVKSAKSGDAKLDEPGSLRRMQVSSFDAKFQAKFDEQLAYMRELLYERGYNAKK